MTVCSICYNEELLIGAWIDHLVELTVIDRIVLVDTGSTDKTLEIIKSKQRKYPGFIALGHGDWNNDFSEQRNKTFRIAQELGAIYVSWIDIDTFFAGPSRGAINGYLYNILSYMNETPVVAMIEMPSMRFKSRSTAIEDIEPTFRHWSIIRLKDFFGSFGELHEQMKVGGEVLRLGSEDNVTLNHYDLAKIFAMAKRDECNAAFIMGLKKFRYLKIRKSVGTLSADDPDPDQMSADDIINFGHKKLEQELKHPTKSGSFNHSRHLDGVLWPTY
jgi:glycosyltransferase involved in cell wall biosynthesis